MSQTLRQKLVDFEKFRAVPCKLLEVWELAYNNVNKPYRVRVGVIWTSGCTPLRVIA